MSDADNETPKSPAPKGPSFNGAKTRYLRGLGHSLDPVLQVGKAGVTEGVVEAALAALLRHELIKVRVLAEADAHRKDVAQDLAAQTKSYLAQVLGRTFLLYRRHPNKPKIHLPGEKAPTTPETRKPSGNTRKRLGPKRSRATAPKEEGKVRPAAPDARGRRPARPVAATRSGENARATTAARPTRAARPARFVRDEDDSDD
jgi:RNA-binding protein